VAEVSVNDRYFEAPNEVPHAVIRRGTMLFLAGGITGCPDWQAEAAAWLLETCKHVVIANPRRAYYPEEGRAAEIGKQQIEWEHHHLLKSRQILFWFPEETDCPITLFELGRHLDTPRRLFIGCHPNYLRRFDVEVQVKLEREEQRVHTSFGSLLGEAISWGQKLDRILQRGEP
jgi:hypothetical protein